MDVIRWARRLAVVAGTAAAVTTPGLLSAHVPMVSAEPCPDVEVVFARGTGEPPGIGSVGGLFVAIDWI